MSFYRGILFFMVICCIGNFAESKPANGELSKQDLYEKFHLKRSGVCYDKYTQCPQWKKDSGCVTAYLMDNCPRSCDACHYCGDRDRNCPEWAKNGSCNKSVYYMYRMCRQSCGAWNWCNDYPKGR
ncbi:uncharacterized protein [Montipora foliosa]